MRAYNILILQLLLTLSMLGKISADDVLKYFAEYRLWHFMQIVSS